MSFHSAADTKCNGNNIVIEPESIFLSYFNWNDWILSRIETIIYDKNIFFVNELHCQVFSCIFKLLLVASCSYSVHRHCRSNLSVQKCGTVAEREGESLIVLNFYQSPVAEFFHLEIEFGMLWGEIHRSIPTLEFLSFPDLIIFYISRLFIIYCLHNYIGNISIIVINSPHFICVIAVNLHFWKRALMDIRDCLELLPDLELNSQDGAGHCQTISSASRGPSRSGCRWGYADFLFERNTL